MSDVDVQFKLHPESKTVSILFNNVPAEQMKTFFLRLGTDDGVALLEHSLNRALLVSGVLTPEQSAELMKEMDL